MKKLFILLFVLLLGFNSVYSVVVSESNPNQNQGTVAETQGVFKEAFANIPWGLIVTITIIAIGIAIILGLVIWGAMWIYKKITEERRKGESLEYLKFTTDLKMCKINADKRYVYPVWYKLWIGKKRAKIYAQTSRGRIYVGEYMGSAVKKEGYFIMGLYQVYTFFSRETDVLIFPFQLHKELIRYNSDFTIDLMCEGVDEVLSSEYFSIPVIKNFSDIDQERIFTDFSNEVMTKYFKDYAYRDVIRTSIQEFREGIRDATEMNPNVQIDRKTNSRLKE